MCVYIYNRHVCVCVCLRGETANRVGENQYTHSAGRSRPPCRSHRRPWRANGGACGAACACAHRADARPRRPCALGDLKRDADKKEKIAPQYMCVCVYVCVCLRRVVVTLQLPTNPSSIIPAAIRKKDMWLLGSRACIRGINIFKGKLFGKIFVCR